MQKVYFSQTQSGIKGLFTNHYLAWEFISEEEIERFEANRKLFCELLDFEYIDESKIR